MSIFDSAQDWPDKYKACGAPHQSPINLSQSFALPCDRLCEWKVDDVSVGSAQVRPEAVSGLASGLGLSDFSNGTPTASFNGEGYTCKKMILYATAQHSLETVFGEAELVATFTHPSGKTVNMSVIVRTSPGDTASAKFFNAFVPYSDSAQEVNLGNSWSLQDVVPDTPAYYVYRGTNLVPPCEPDVIWIVYSNTVTMDPSDYAKLAKNVKPARRPLEEVGDRQVMFYDAQGVSTPRDGKLYLKCRRPGGAGKKEEQTERMVQPGGLQDEVDKQESESSTKRRNNFRQAAADQYNSMGGIWGILEVLTLLVIAGLLFFTESGKKIGGLYFTIVFFIPNLIRSLVIWLIWGRKTAVA
uniref:carbonic anhydrase n=1 Tax=viral metagenome TaxID=1070528 RepID=A0A6C0K6H8_9ZZZZ